jgi:histidine triad (HIT) family protein
MIEKRGGNMCVFCKIANHEIPSKIVYEDDTILAFLDIQPVTKGHTLIIPKKHYPNYAETPSDVVAHVHEVTVILTKRYEEVLKPAGFNFLSNMNEAAGQTMFHTHFHLIPRYDDNDGLLLKFSHLSDADCSVEECQKLMRK